MTCTLGVVRRDVQVFKETPPAGYVALRRLRRSLRNEGQLTCSSCAHWGRYPYNGNHLILKGGTKFVPDYLNWPITLPTVVVEDTQISLNFLARVVTGDPTATDFSCGPGWKLAKASCYTRGLGNWLKNADILATAVAVSKKLSFISDQESYSSITIHETVAG